MSVDLTSQFNIKIQVIALLCNLMFVVLNCAMTFKFPNEVAISKDTKGKIQVHNASSCGGSRCQDRWENWLTLKP